MGRQQDAAGEHRCTKRIRTKSDFAVSGVGVLTTARAKGNAAKVGRFVSSGERSVSRNCRGFLVLRQRVEQWDLVFWRCAFRAIQTKSGRNASIRFGRAAMSWRLKRRRTGRQQSGDLAETSGRGPVFLVRGPSVSRGPCLRSEINTSSRGGAPSVSNSRRGLPRRSTAARLASYSIR
jgi:hypothetical protein